MSLSINTNTAAMAALQSLNQTTTDLNKTENAVSTGKSVNSASDNPAIYAIAQSMTSQVSALSGVSTGLQFAGQVLSTASTQASSISTLLTSVSTTVLNAANNAENQDTLNSQLSSLGGQIDAAANSATFQGVNLLSGATGSGVTYTSVSAAQDINGNLFTQNGASVTAAGLGLEGLSTTMQGATITLGNASYKAADTGTTPAASTLTLKNQAATGNSGTASNPAIGTTFVMDDNTGGALSSVATLGQLLSTAVTTAMGGTTATVTVGTDGKLTSTAIDASKTLTASDGTTTYTLTNGKSISAKADTSGNMTYSVTTATDSNGNATSLAKIVDVNTNAAATKTSDTTQQNTDRTTTLMAAMSNAGFGVSRDNDGTLTIGGGNLDASAVTANTSTPTPLDLSAIAPTDGGTALSIASTSGTTSYIANSGTSAAPSTAVRTALGSALSAATGETITVGADGTLTGDTSSSVTGTASAGFTVGSNTYKLVSYTTGTTAASTFTTNLSDAASLTQVGSTSDYTTTASGNDITPGAGIKIDGGVTIGTTSGTAVVQLAVNAAITKLSNVSSSLGVASNTVTQLQSSTSSLSDSLTTGIGALTDADLAAESAKLTSLQTKQQLAVQSLSIANSQSSTLLSLFRG